MKFNKIIIAGGLVAASMSLGSCVGDLDLTPTNPSEITEGIFKDDPEGYMRKSIADVYMQVAAFGYGGSDGEDKNILGSMDGGMSTFQRAVFCLEEIPSDEANWIPSADAIPPTFQYGEIPSTDLVVMGSYSRMQVISSLANQFIQTDFGLQNDEQRALREEFVRQAKILRDGMYFYLISNFGNVPWNDENVMIGSVAPQLSTDFKEGRRLVTEAVVADLEDIVAWYKANDPNNNPPYGYVGLDVAESLLVKFYLNYEVFTGTAAWDKCYTHANDVITRRAKGGFVASDGHATGLAKGYHQNFSYNNKTQDEIIWRIPQESVTLGGDHGLKSYANGGFMVNMWIGDAPADKDFKCTQAEYNSGNGWKCATARRQFVEVFDWDANYANSPDVRVKWWKTAKDGFNINNDVLTQAGWGENGFLPVKYTNWYINDNNEVDEALSPAKVDPLGIDYGMIRLAEIYLSAAEAALNGGGDASVALRYVNYIRERAGMDTYTNLNLVELQNERQRELYTECTRRTDLVRYGKWVSGYNWNWKNHAKDGCDFAAHQVVYPLPNTVCVTNGYTQNPEY